METVALKGISFDVQSGEAFGILGESGAGKTTLARVLNGLLIPTKGLVTLGGKEIHRFGPKLRHKVGLVFQRPERQLFEETVTKDISFVLRHFAILSALEITERVKKAANLVNVDLDQLGERSPLALSEGERRKVAIAGVLVNDPVILILDEPAVGMDPISSRCLVEMITEFKEMGDRSVIVVSHDLEPFLGVLDRLLVLDRGRVAAFGTLRDVYTALRDSDRLRGLLPELVVFVQDLGDAGIPINREEFRIAAISNQLVGMMEQRLEARRLACDGTATFKKIDSGES